MCFVLNLFVYLMTSFHLPFIHLSTFPSTKLQFIVLFNFYCFYLISFFLSSFYLSSPFFFFPFFSFLSSFPSVLPFPFPLFYISFLSFTSFPYCLSICSFLTLFPSFPFKKLYLSCVYVFNMILFICLLLYFISVSLLMFTLSVSSLVKVP